MKNGYNIQNQTRKIRKEWKRIRKKKKKWEESVK